MSDNPVHLDTDEDGVHIRIDLDYLDSASILLNDDNRIVSGRMSMSAAWDLYEHVEKELGAWYREGAAIARQVQAARATVDERDALDTSDPDHPDYADRLADYGDRVRKETRENG